MSDHSKPDYQSCLEMWRNAVSTTWQQRAAQHIVKREQIENNMVQLQIEAAEQSLARLQLAAAPQGVEHEDEGSEVSDCVSQSGPNSMEASWGNSVSFSGDYHPQDRQPMRHGTPAALPTDANGYLADDEGETTRALRRKTRGSASPSNVSCLTLLLPTPSPLQSPALSPRPLKPSEVWDEEAPGEPIYAPVPLRPLIKPELLLVGYFEEPHMGSDSTFLKNSGARTMDQRLERISGLLDDLKKIHKDLHSFLGHR
ncbi:hypothetical protein LA080_000264 [Diaporthe eres]|nr:hypothetical protein LA080_000264 [Diaporthe eres]